MNTTSHRYALADLEKLAREKTEELSGFIGIDLQLEWPPRSTTGWEFRDWEIEWFLRAYREYALFQLTPRTGPRSTKWPSGCPRVDFSGDMMPTKPSGEPYVHEFLVAWEMPRA